MRVVKAAAVQLGPVLYSREGTVDKIVRTASDSQGPQGRPPDVREKALPLCGRTAARN